MKVEWAKGVLISSLFESQVAQRMTVRTFRLIPVDVYLLRPFPRSLQAFVHWMS